jgi:hypothetical protein
MKENTISLWNIVNNLYEQSTTRFRYLYPKKSTQMAYWIMYLIHKWSMEDQTEMIVVAIRVLRAAQDTTKTVRGASKTPDKPNWGSRLTADFDSFEHDDIANKGIYTLSARVDRLNDW